MANAKLKGYRADEIIFVNKRTKTTPMEIQTKYSYNVKYANNGTCRGEMTVEIQDKNEPDTFNLKIVLSGLFEFTEAPREVLHKETFNSLFPYIRSMITTVTANSGIMPIIVPIMDIENQSIYKIEKNENWKGNANG
ncbi:MAG: protein-export chaperone SecB [Clostridia bacterium]|nr:protein-export chaperone SecB [Clostridia bacterium]